MNEETIEKDKFEKWFNDIKDQLIQIIICQKINNQMRYIFKENPKLHRGGNFWNWLDQNYIYSIVIQVARLVEKGRYSDDRSFHKFLSELKNADNYKIVISEEKYLEKFGPFLEEHLGEKYIRNEFKKITLNQQIIEVLNSDVIILDNIFEKFEKLRHKKIAHLTSTELNISELPTYNDIDKSIEELKKLVNKYSLLINANHIVFDVPIYYGKIFNIPWIENKNL